MTTRALAVVSAGLSVPSSTRLLADRLTTATVEALHERGDDVTVEIVELRDHARDLADNLVTGFPNAALRASVETVTGADGLIAVTPIFSASYSGLFKTFFDVLDRDALIGKPTLLGATAGTAGHSLALEFALRPLFAYLRATVAPTGGVRRLRGLGRRRRRQPRTQRADRAGGSRAGRPDRRSPGGCPGRPLRGAVRWNPTLRAAAPQRLTAEQVDHEPAEDRSNLGTGPPAARTAVEPPRTGCHSRARRARGAGPAGGRPLGAVGEQQPAVAVPGGPPRRGHVHTVARRPRARQP